MTEVIIRVINSDGEPVTGLGSSNIKLRKSPYGPGDEIGGVNVSEIGTQGNYKITGFVQWQKAKLYINGILQDWWGEQFTGDPANSFVDFRSAQTISGNKIFSGSNTYNGSNNFTGNNQHGGSEIFSGGVEFDGSASFINGQLVTMLGDTVIRNAIAPDVNTVPAANNLIWRAYADSNYFPVCSNRLIVDSRLAADIEGKAYRRISDAMNRAYNFGSPSINNRWEIFVVPHHTAQYTEDFYWYDFIDIIGLGWVKIKNTAGRSVFIRSGQMTDRNVKAVNLHFETTDTNLNFKQMIIDNSSIVMIEDNYQPVITLEDSQLRNCYIGSMGTGTVTPAGVNRAINCTGGISVKWGLQDKVYNFVCIEGDNIQQ